MITIKNKYGTKKLVIYAAAALVFVVCLLTVLELTGATNLISKSPAQDSVLDSDGPTEEQKQTDDAINAANKQEALEQETAQPTPDPTPPESSSIELSAQQEGSTSVTIFTKLHAITSGSCSITVTNGSASTTQTAMVIYQPEYSSCAGFSIPISGLGAGTWQVNLKVDSNGTSATKSLSFEVT